MAKEEPLVSVIIPTYNSERTIEKCLESIKRQTYKNIEIIVVDKGSNDRTVEISRRYTDKVFVINAKERTDQVNFGIKMARGKYIYYIGSDFILLPKTIEILIKLCEKLNYDAAVVPNYSDPRISFIAKIRFVERLCYIGDFIMSAARFIRRDIILKLGGYPPYAAMEEHYVHDLLLQKKYKILLFPPKVISYPDIGEIHIGEPKSLKEILLKSLYYGYYIKQYIISLSRKLRKNKENKQIRQIDKVNWIFKNKISSMIVIKLLRFFPIRPSHLLFWIKIFPYYKKIYSLFDVKESIIILWFIMIIYQLIRFIFIAIGIILPSSLVIKLYRIIYG